MGFGGVGSSGYGRYGGYDGFTAFSNKKGVLIKGHLPPRVMNMLLPPYDLRFQGLFKQYAVTISNTNQSTVLFYVKLVLLIIVGLLLYRYCF